MAHIGGGLEFDAVTRRSFGVAEFVFFAEKLAEGEVGVGEILAAQLDGGAHGLFGFLGLSETVIGEPHLQVGFVVGGKRRDGALAVRQASRRVMFLAALRSL